MVDVVLSNDDLSILGGPASIDVNVGVGAQGIRGTYIFTGKGKPTDPSITFLDNADQNTKSVQEKDLYINLKPTDDEYLYLYQYEPTLTGSYQWTKTLRLVPNTAIANTPVIFYNGKAVTFTSTASGAAELVATADFSTIVAGAIAPADPSDSDLWLDISGSVWLLKLYVIATTSWVEQGTVTPKIFFPLAAYFQISEGDFPSASSFNIQYTIVNEKPIASGITVDEIPTSGSDIVLPINLTATEATINPSTGAVTWSALTGIRTVQLLMTGGVS